MSDADQVAQIGQMIDRYTAASNPMLLRGVASQRPSDRGVPPDMWASKVDREGWVTWRVMPSTLHASDIDQLQLDFSVVFPPLFRAYLLARHHCFGQVQSLKHDQLIMFPDLPTREPLHSLRQSLHAWKFLLPAGLIPFAEWGDGWGPMCFDTQSRHGDGECPILWLDHEQIIPLGEKASDRQVLRRLEMPLYGSFRDLLEDVFAVLPPDNPPPHWTTAAERLL